MISRKLKFTNSKWSRIFLLIGLYLVSGAFGGCQIVDQGAGSAPVIQDGQNELVFILDKTISSEPGNNPVQGCWPSSYFDDGQGFLVVNPDQTISGECGWTSPSKVNPQVTWNNHGALSGTIAPEGKISFRLETKAVYPELGTEIRIVFEADGVFVFENRAEGTAVFTSVCSSRAGEAQCGFDQSGKPRSTWSVKGTVPWRIDFFVKQK